MPAPFAAIEARANVAVLATLANAVAVVDGVEVQVMFDKPYQPTFDSQIDSVAPECVGPAAALDGLQRGDAIVVDGITYAVVRAEPDGVGMVRLVLGED